MTEARDELTKVLRSWVELSDAEAETVMDYVTHLPGDKVLAITGPAGSGKTWLLNVIQAMAPDLLAIDEVDAGMWPSAKAQIRPDRPMVMVARTTHYIQELAGGREVIEIARDYHGPINRRMDLDEVREDIEHAMGKRTLSDRLTDGLRNWAEQKEVTPAEFSKMTGFSYQHSHNLLRGNTRTTFETLGRVALSYGLEAVEDILGLVRQGE